MSKRRMEGLERYCIERFFYFGEWWVGYGGRIEEFILSMFLFYGGFVEFFFFILGYIILYVELLKKGDMF